MRFIIILIGIFLVYGCPSNEIVYIFTDSEDASIDTIISEDANSDIVSGPYSECDSNEKGIICVGVSKKSISPQRYELVKRDLLVQQDYCPEFDGPGNCGKMDLEKWKQLSKKWKTDFFYDCGTDRICPDDENYSGPDSDGSEGDGVFQGLWIAGYSGSTPVLGVHDDIWARAIVLRHSGKTVAIVTLDLIGFFKSDVDRVRALLNSKAPGLKIDNIIIDSSHTHSSIDTVGMWGPQDPFSGVPYETGANDEYIRGVVQNIVEAIIEAGVSMERGRVRAITERVGIEGMVNDIRDPFIIDDHMSVVLFEGLDGRRIATLINRGSHPRGTGWGYECN